MLGERTDYLLERTCPCVITRPYGVQQYVGDMLLSTLYERMHCVFSYYGRPRWRRSVQNVNRQSATLCQEK